jgi:hypothetical protein
MEAPGGEPGHPRSGWVFDHLSKEQEQEQYKLDEVMDSDALVDELRLMVFPVAVGGGLRVFPDDGNKLSLALADTKVFPTGVAVHTYRKL